MIRSIFLTLCALVASALTTAHAHSIWIETNTAQQLVIRFAEPGDDFETPPGYLDDLLAPAAFTVVANKAVSVEAPKKSDHFLLVGASSTNIACTKTTFIVRGGRKPIFYARWQPANVSAGKPMLTLDLVPTGKPGEVRAYFRGQPLGGVTAWLRTPDEKESELTADADGFIHFKAEAPGQYLLTIAHHREDKPLAGFYKGTTYTETSHNCSLCWIK